MQTVQDRSTALARTLLASPSVRIGAAGWDRPQRCGEGNHGGSLVEDQLGLCGPWSITVGAGSTEFVLGNHVSVPFTAVAFTAVARAPGRVALTLDVWLSAMLRRGIEQVLTLPALDQYFDTPVWVAVGMGGGVVTINGPGTVDFVGHSTRVRFDDVEAGLSRRLVVEHSWLPSLEHALRPWRDGARHLDEGLPSLAV